LPYQYDKQSCFAQIFCKLGHLANVPGENFFYDVGSYFLKMVGPGILKYQKIGPGE